MGEGIVVMLLSNKLSYFEKVYRFIKSEQYPKLIEYRFYELLGIATIGLMILSSHS